MHQTPLDAQHRALGARMIPFAGWEMPVQYAGIVQEHQAVRTAAGLFDLSHMGELWIRGPGAAAALDAALVTAPSRLKDGRAHYSMICAPDGSVMDDLIVYRTAAEEFLVVANASNREVVAAALAERLAGHDATLDDASLRTALIAIQGPRAVELLQAHTDIDLSPLKYYSIAAGQVCKRAALIARTGYTGEDGFEVYLAWDDAARIWNHLLEEGKAAGLVPAGLGARDTLRLEAGMPLYGQELDRETTPFEAGLGRVVKFDKDGDFVGRAALEAVKDAPAKVLVGLRLTGRGIARTGYPVYLPAAAEAVGRVTSGTASPTLGHPIAMAFVPAELAAPDTALEVGIRADRVPAVVIPMPFYRRPT
ncbi:MAG: glycine cleavage system aminomethyltransferase GcvT [Gemmatimonadetes bacterium]|nr:glycine cleavage system aminomethyltransferase GcvT [Gemmatimonadota bacterium]MCB9505497.1 glycine cleavage system aminomethyltransferase GcvT [Gemmatimonadales bacterium]MCB9519136.1 glycine cleavage system aminomethyltransferase GcvT [Gemmatimonadales bacterium]